MIRAFVAIDLPECAVDALERLQDRLPVGRAAAPGTLHLTLAFLGEQPEDLLADCHFALQSLTARAFELRLSGLGTFGAKVPRVLFVGAENSPPLAELQGKVASTARGFGLEADTKPFRPHVTIARFGNGLSGGQLDRLRRFLSANGAFALPPFPVTHFSLYRSTLGRAGAAHEELAHYPLLQDCEGRE